MARQAWETRELHALAWEGTIYRSQQDTVLRRGRGRREGDTMWSYRTISQARFPYAARCTGAKRTTAVYSVRRLGHYSFTGRNRNFVSLGSSELNPSC
jgi:hypothetical protein